MLAGSSLGLRTLLSAATKTDIIGALKLAKVCCPERKERGHPVRHSRFAENAVCAEKSVRGTTLTLYAALKVAHSGQDVRAPCSQTFVISVLDLIGSYRISE